MRRLAFVSSILLLAAHPAAAQVNFTVVGALGDLDGNGDGGAGEAAVVNQVLACWSQRIGTARNFTLNVATAALSGGTIGQGAVSAVNGAGVPTAGGVTFDNDGSTTYFVDATPLVSSEFDPDPNSQWRFLGGTNTDLFSVFAHEVGHASAWLCGAPCGFTNPSYDALMNPAFGSFVANSSCAPPFPLATQPALPGCVHLQDGGGHPYDVSLRGDGLGGSGSSIVNELSHPGISGELMIGFYTTGARELPTQNSVDLFAHAYGDAVNLPMTVNAGTDVVSECNATGGSNVSLNGNGSQDPEGNTPTWSWSCPGVTLAGANTATPSGFFLLDDTVECRLDAGDLAACPPGADIVDVTVQDTTDPSVLCPAPLVAECSATGGTPVSDPAVQTFLAGASASDICDATLAITNNAPPFFDLGIATQVTFSTQDDSFNSGSCLSSVTVVDTTAPVIGDATASPAILWPPNHHLVPVSVAVEVTDVCDASAACTITSITSDEGEGNGSGNAAPDWQITGPLTANLRAERSGQGDGRVYTLSLECSDGSGNTAARTVNVLVPHDRR